MPETLTLLIAALLLGLLVGAAFAHFHRRTRRLTPQEHVTLQLVQTGMRSHGFRALDAEHVAQARAAARLITGEARR